MTTILALAVQGNDTRGLTMPDDLDEIVLRYYNHDYTYEVEIDEDEDVRKMWHCITVDEKRYTMDFSPYRQPSDTAIKLWIQLGHPTRSDIGSIGPLRDEDLTKLAWDRGLLTNDYGEPADAKTNPN